MNDILSKILKFPENKEEKNNYDKIDNNAYTRVIFIIEKHRNLIVSFFFSLILFIWQWSGSFSQTHP